MTRIIIRGVAERNEWVEYLTERIPDAEWSMDDKGWACGNFIRAFRIAGNDPCVHMEDDVILCSSFRDILEREIDERPASIIQFFCMRDADLTVGSRWDNTFSMNQCFYIPPNMGPAMLRCIPQWLAKHPEHPNGYDLFMRDWMRSVKLKYWIHCPSIVQHRAGDSMISPRARNRQSKSFQEAYGNEC